MSDAAGEEGASRGCSVLLRELHPDLYRELYRDYVSHHEGRLWPRGAAAAAPGGDEASPLAEGARRLVRSRGRDAPRSAAFDVRGTAAEMVRRSGSESDWRLVLLALGRAAELLETYSLNVALFPWRKEMKSVKTFTGPFVYYIQSAVPEPVARKVLENIGYRKESDTEYRLSEDVGSQKAMQAAFQLFLAKLECEHLLEVLAQSTPSECIRFLQMRSSDPDGTGFGEVPPADISDVSEGGPPGSEEPRPLVDLASSLKDDSEFVADSPNDSEQSPRSLETPPPRAVGQPYTFLRDDRSILEMQKNYPDLAIRQKPVFAAPEGCLEAPANDTNSPRSAAVVPEVEAPREARGLGAQQGMADDLRVAQLSVQLDMMHIKEHCGDDNLKYPIEETAHLDASAPLAPQGLMCGPSHSCVRPPTTGVSGSGHDTIKEPPQSFYIPPSPLGAECGAEPCMDPASPWPQRLEDDLLKTYVMVDREKKDVRPDSTF